MRALVSGASGLVGRALVGHLEARGDFVVPLVRRDGASGVRWDPKTGRFDDVAAEGFDAVVHLAGENVAARRWTDRQRTEIRDSRVGGTRLLAEHLAGLGRPPRVLVCASAVGFYGDGGGVACTEASPRGRGFLAEVCELWEAASGPASARGIRVVTLRIGLVLATEGGAALPRMLPAFRMGLGAQLGDVKQWMSWIALADLVAVIERAITDETLRGPVNAVAPEPVTNAEFTATLAHMLGRPAFLAVPALVLRAVLGGMADELLLSGARVIPARLQDAGFSFEHTKLESTLRALTRR
jgi:uncharacterized protein (TIGR01777 family)